MHAPVKDPKVASTIICSELAAPPSQPGVYFILLDYINGPVKIFLGCVECAKRLKLEEEVNLYGSGRYYDPITHMYHPVSETQCTECVLHQLNPV